MKQLLSCLVMALLVSACAARQDALFRNAVDDAAVVESSDVFGGLLPVSKDHPDLIWNADKSRILVVMWKSRNSYEKFYKNQHATAPSEAYVTWVTLAPQVREFGRAFLASRPGATQDQLNLRLKQYLGLKPEWTYDLFIELWVRPEDMFRPCVDPETDDTVCNIRFGTPLPRVKNIADYACFYKDLYFNDFRIRPGVPWTGMGYTYDWGRPDHPFGASEYILVPGTPYEIRRVVATRDYF